MLFGKTLASDPISHFGMCWHRYYICPGVKDEQPTFLSFVLEVTDSTTQLKTLTT